MTLNIASFKQKLFPALNTRDKETEKYLKARIAQIESLPVNEQTWSGYRNFWPPTIIRALRERRLIFFMGAGTSAASDLPTWRELLEQRFGVPTAFINDENLKNDNLTLGEIASRLLGREVLQSSLRSIYNNTTILPTAIHYYLAALELPVYVTTNYDGLFEFAWAKTHGTAIDIICNSSDVKKYAASPHKLYKIHGSAGRLDELLVLTRSEYRQHYRSNTAVFDEIKTLIQTNPTVFAGFSHTDPEISRLIDDVIFRYEYDAQHGTPSSSPDLYNVQFENNYVTNERFAAKGMVSLNIRLVEELSVDARTGGVADSIGELVNAMASKMDDVTSVESELNNLVAKVRSDLDRAIGELKTHAAGIASALAQKPIDGPAIAQILDSVDLRAALSTQGLYLLNAAGQLVDRRYLLLDEVERDRVIDGIRNNFGSRPYFQMSKSFRRPFVSDFFQSIFNNNSTFAICMPIINNENFLGLLFSACQIGQWKTPIEAVDSVTAGLGAYILDGQGMVALPPHMEFSARVSALMGSEVDEVRTGYDYTDLKILSKKDRVINRLAENIVPVQKDDDVLSLDKDLDIYALIQNVGDLGWRCAVSRTIKFAR